MTAEPASQEGRTIDRYAVGELLGRGGFGAVYAARHTVVGRDVALKVLWAEHARDPKQVERFMREARAAAAIGHPGIVRVLDAGTTPDGVAFLAMERLDGATLEERLRDGGPLPPAEAVSIVGSVLDALGAAHAAGIIHRDLKPGNVFLTGDGEVKLLDFGISKIGGERALTATGLVLGTPPYMAPEQLGGTQSIDGRVDLYAAATMLYELLSGEVPFPGQGYEVIVERLKGARPPPLASRAPHVPRPLVQVIERGLALDRDARFVDAASFRRALEEGLAGRWAAEAGGVATAARPSPIGGVAVGAGIGPSPPRTVPPVGPAPETDAAVTAPRRAPLEGVPAGAPPLAAPGEATGVGPPSPAATPRPAPAATEARPPPPEEAGSGVLWWVAASALAVLLATAFGIFGVLVYRLFDRDADPGRSGSAVQDAPRPGGSASAPSQPTPEQAPEPLAAALQDTAPQNAASQNAASQNAASQNTASQNTASQNTASQNTASQNTAPQNAASQNAASQNTASQNTASQNSALQDRGTASPETAAPAPVRPVEVAPRAAADPRAVRYDVFHFVGRSRPPFDATLRRARPGVARCSTGRAVTVSVHIIATLGGEITIADPHPSERSNRPIARCVAAAIQAAGPVELPSDQTAIADIRVDVPGG